MKKVLVLEDEASIRSFIVINLQRAGYEVVEAECGEEALQKLQENPDTKLCLLDIMLPDIDGFEVCRRIRMSNAQVGIIMLTARTQEMDKVTGLMTGADDYVTKPFSPAELTARVDALLRRMGENTPATHTGELYQPPFLLNLTNRTLEKNGERVKLTQIEYAIVKLFMENSGKALARGLVCGQGGHAALYEVKRNAQMALGGVEVPEGRSALGAVGGDGGRSLGSRLVAQHHQGGRVVTRADHGGNVGKQRSRQTVAHLFSPFTLSLFLAGQNARVVRSA